MKDISISMSKKQDGPNKGRRRTRSPSSDVWTFGKQEYFGRARQRSPFGSDHDRDDRKRYQGAGPARHAQRHGCHEFGCFSMTTGSTEFMHPARNLNLNLSPTYSEFMKD